MHHIPKFFVHSSDRRKNRMESGSSRQAAKLKPWLDRRNAAKNINYDSSPSFVSASSAPSSYYSSEESIRTRSLDFYESNTSFRIDGVDGEIDILCKTLGFARIEDFGIPPEEYEAMKVRSSSDPVLLSEAIEPLIDRKLNVNYYNVGVSSRATNFVGRNGDLISTKCAEIHDLGYPSNTLDTVHSSLGDRVPITNVILSDNVSGRSNQFPGNGIKGVRPPVLAPPPSMSLPVIDKYSSTWDMVRAFAPDSDTCSSRFGGGLSLEDDNERTGDWRRDKEDDEGYGRERVTRREENYALSEPYYFTTSSNDDSSSTTTPLSSNSPEGRFRRVIVNWQKGVLLGRGSFGSVYEGIADDGFFFAVKEVSLLDQEDEGRQSILQLEQEIILLSQFEHENIVQYYGTKKDDSRLYIFLELVTKGSLLSLYQKFHLGDLIVSAYTRQILHGLKYLHDRDVVHRDIKCANILVDASGLVKLADFGLAKATKLNDVKSCKGTAFWMAPEVVRSLGYGLPADIWSLGCTVLELLTRNFPYSNLECMAALFRIGRGIRPDIPDSLSSNARDFIFKCLQVDPSLRPTAAQLLDHPFVKRPLPSTSALASPRHFNRHK